MVRHWIEVQTHYKEETSQPVSWFIDIDSIEAVLEGSEHEAVLIMRKESTLKSPLITINMYHRVVDFIKRIKLYERP